MYSLIKTVLILCFLAFGLDSKLAQRILYEVQKAAITKIVKGPGSLEKLSNRLTGHRSEWLWKKDYKRKSGERARVKSGE